MTDLPQRATPKEPARAANAGIEQVRLVIASDPRLLAGVAGAVNHFGELAGLGEGARAELVAAVEDVCRDALERTDLENHGVELTLELAPGKIEAVVEYHAAAPLTPPAGQEALRLRLDSVERQSRSGLTRITLVKKARR